MLNSGYRTQFIQHYENINVCADFGALRSQSTSDLSIHTGCSATQGGRLYVFFFFLREVLAIQSMKFMYMEDSSLRRAAS
jgi:hypothetical protein